MGLLPLKVSYDNHVKPAKQVYIGGLKALRLSDMLGNLNSVLFAPEDLSMIKGSPQERRNFLDYDISQVSLDYFHEVQRYQRILAQRNYLLKQIYARRRDKTDLMIWDEQLLSSASLIIDKRLQVLERLNPLTRLMQRKLTRGRENLEIRYLLNRRIEIKHSKHLKESLEAMRHESLSEEIKRGTTLWGPHRDDLSLTVNGMDLKSFGSQGQHRTAVLALKLSELEFFRGESGEYPILLLDDVMSELDASRREELMCLIQSKEIQCFITTAAPLDALKRYGKQTNIYHIQAGTIQKQTTDKSDEA
jgi:DNA replication and repair protein RecF